MGRKKTDPSKLSIAPVEKIMMVISLDKKDSSKWNAFAKAYKITLTNLDRAIDLIGKVNPNSKVPAFVTAYREELIASGHGRKRVAVQIGGTGNYRVNNYNQTKKVATTPMVNIPLGMYEGMNLPDARVEVIFKPSGPVLKLIQGNKAKSWLDVSNDSPDGTASEDDTSASEAEENTASDEAGDDDADDDDASDDESPQ